MCKGSIHAVKSFRAQLGEVYAISTYQLGLGIMDVYYAVAHPPGVSPQECVACVKQGDKIHLSNIPEDLQRRHLIGSSAEALFIDGGDYEDDEIFFPNGSIALFKELADKNVTLTVIAIAAVVPDDTTAEKPIQQHEPAREIAPV